MDVQPKRTFRRLINPLQSQSENTQPRTRSIPLPEINSKHITPALGHKDYSFKDFLTKGRYFSYRNKCKMTLRSESKTITQSLIMNCLIEIKFMALELWISIHESVMKDMGRKGKKKRTWCKSRVRALENYVTEHPLLEPKTVHAEMMKLRQKFTKSMVI